ncbi:adenylate kinase [Nematocida sp. LUAm3]|nr:adenylate kinase [Nematocida sp. LUAm3]KAI5175721.1 adenylate kinase [Nematocida sp. LUAm2]KAI5178627.1 adenylate kinase [Nematocida sp. LUAm1]
MVDALRNKCRLIVLGMPLAGKGTQCTILSEQLGIPHISTGDILRQEMKKNTEQAKYIRNQLSNGLFVSDKVIQDLLNERLTKIEHGFILDGFPRTIEQFENISFPYDKMLFIDTPVHLILDRVEGRLCHMPSGRIYHEKYNPPLNPEKDDITNEPLTRRDDDKRELINRRVLDFLEKTGKVIEAAIQKGVLVVIDGSKPMDQINKEIHHALCTAHISTHRHATRST